MPLLRAASTIWSSLFFQSTSSSLRPSSFRRPSRPASTDESATLKRRVRSVSGMGSRYGEMPASSANSRRSRWQTEWIVPM